MDPTSLQRLELDKSRALPRMSTKLKRRRSHSLDIPARERHRIYPPSIYSTPDRKYLSDDQHKRQQSSPSAQYFARATPSLAKPPLQLAGLNIQRTSKGIVAVFSLSQKKTIFRWMRTNSARYVRKNEVSFSQLLFTLGFTHPGLPPEVKMALQRKVRRLIWRTGNKLLKGGLITVELDENNNETVKFGEWTKSWMLSDWDGQTRRTGWMDIFFEPNFNELGWTAGTKFQGAVGDVCHPLGPEILVVEEPEALEDQEDDFVEDLYSSRDEFYDGEWPSTPSFQPSYLATARHSHFAYQIDISELPQYQGVQLTPNDRYHPQRPDLEFMALHAQVFYDDEYDEETCGEEPEEPRNVEVADTATHDTKIQEPLHHGDIDDDITSDGRSDSSGSGIL